MCCYIVPVKLRVPPCERGNNSVFYFICVGGKNLLQLTLIHCNQRITGTFTKSHLKKGIFVRNTEVGKLLPGSASDGISFRVKACHAHTVLTIPVMFGNWECHHKDLGKNGVTAGQGNSCWLCSPDLQPDPSQHPSTSQLLLVLSTRAATRPDQCKPTVNSFP